MKRAVLKITPELLGEIFRNGKLHVKIESGIPKEAKFISAWYNYDKTCFNLCYESPQFEEVEEGESMPILPLVRYTKIEV